MTTRTVATMDDGDPVIVEGPFDGPDYAPDEIHLRIGAVRQGGTRYAILNREQAIRIASNLLRAVLDIP